MESISCIIIIRCLEGDTGEWRVIQVGEGVELHCGEHRLHRHHQVGGG